MLRRLIGEDLALALDLDPELEQTLVDPGPAVKDIFVPVVLPNRAVHLIFRTVAPNGVATSLLIEDVSLVTPAPRDASHLAAR